VTVITKKSLTVSSWVTGWPPHTVIGTLPRSTHLCSTAWTRIRTHIECLRRWLVIDNVENADKAGLTTAEKKLVAAVEGPIQRGGGCRDGVAVVSGVEVVGVDAFGRCCVRGWCWSRSIAIAGVT
jgi:hypothetical protein